MEWYYASNRQQLGPVSQDELIELVRSGKIQPTDLVWNASMTSWQPFKEVLEVPAAESTATTATDPAPAYPEPAPSVEPHGQPPAQASATPEAVVPQAAAPAAPASENGDTVPNYLWQSIVLIFCCWPLAIVAIVNATKVKPALEAGDEAAAREASAKAKKWCIITLIVGVVVWLINIITSVAMGLMGASQGVQF